MMMKIRKQCKSNKGFTLVELMVVIAILGILAAIAIPRFADTTTAANTAKIAADLRTIDSAISMHQASNSTTATMALLVSNGYLAAEPKPPVTASKVYINGSAATTTKTTYELSGTGSAMRAVLDAKYSEEYRK